VKNWIRILENLYVLFIVTPYHRNLARAILKEPKVYFYDTGAVRGDFGARLENAVAVSLRKWAHFLEDTTGADMRLFYLRDKEKREVDFLIEKDGKVRHLIEVKTGEMDLSSGLRYFHHKLNSPDTIQLVYEAKRTLSKDGIFITPAAEWLAKLDI
jgi:predicted AAA+ superfamily ATPase